MPMRCSTACASSTASRCKTATCSSNTPPAATSAAGFISRSSRARGASCAGHPKAARATACSRAVRSGDADVALEQPLVGGELARGAGVRDAAALEDKRLRGERKRDLGVLLDEDHGHAGEVGERLRKLLDDERREALERLIEEQEPGVGQERARDGEHLLLAPGKLIAPVRAPLGEAR